VCGFSFIDNSNEAPSDLGNSFFRLVSGFNLVWMGLVMLFKQDYLVILPSIAVVLNFIAIIRVTNFFIIEDSVKR
jgi:hypothetical protein